MQKTMRTLALIPSLMGLAACAGIGKETRKFVGLDASPVTTEDKGSLNDTNKLEVNLRRELLADLAVYSVCLNGRCETSDSSGKHFLWPDAVPKDIRELRKDPKAIDADTLITHAGTYYEVGKLSMRSRCEGFMQKLASVQSTTSYGRDLGNNLFDLATIGATVSGSPVGWATGLSTAQSGFNSANGSIERYLLITDSVGALRDKVVNKMTDLDSKAPDFDAVFSETDVKKKAIDAPRVTRQAIADVQSYGVLCSEAGLRQMITKALTEDRPTLTTISVINQAQIIRHQIEETISTATGDKAYQLRDTDLYLLYLYQGIDPNATDADTTRRQVMKALSRGEKGDKDVFPALVAKNKLAEALSLVGQLSMVDGLGKDLATGAESMRTALAPLAAAPVSTPPPPPPPQDDQQQDPSP